MMLSHFALSQPLVWTGKNVCTLVLESPSFLRSFAQELLLQAEGEERELLLSDHGQPVEAEKVLDVITDVLRVDPAENKKLISAQLRDLTALAIHEMPKELTELYLHIQELISQLCFRADAELSHTESNDVSALLKLCNLRPDTADCSLAEILLMHMELSAKYLKKKLFVVFHLHDYLSFEELQSFFRDVIHRELKLLLIESHLENRTKEETVRIIDRDLCEIF